MRNLTKELLEHSLIGANIIIEKIMNKIKNVLLIEDDEATNYLTKYIFDTFDCAENIHSCLDSSEALKLLMQDNFETPDLILLDINMPGMDGCFFLEHFEKIELENKNDIVIHMLSTSIFEEDKQKALNNKYVKNFLNKPLTIDTLNLILNNNF